jgi:hypothetical protein
MLKLLIYEDKTGKALSELLKRTSSDVEDDWYLGRTQESRTEI